MFAAAGSSRGCAALRVLQVVLLGLESPGRSRSLRAWGILGLRSRYCDANRRPTVWGRQPSKGRFHFPAKLAEPAVKGAASHFYPFHTDVVKEQITVNLN